MGGVGSGACGLCHLAVPLARLARLERRALLAVELALQPAERRPPTHLQVRRKPVVDDAHAVDERRELIERADVLRVQLEAVWRAAVREESVELLAQQPPALAHDRGVGGADGGHLRHPTVGQDGRGEKLCLVLAGDRVLTRLDVTHEHWLGRGEDEVEHMALLHARPPVGDEADVESCRDLLSHLTRDAPVLVIQEVVAQRPVGQPSAPGPRRVQLAESGTQLCIAQRLERQALGVAETCKPLVDCADLGLSQDALRVAADVTGLVHLLRRLRGGSVLGSLSHLVEDTLAQSLFGLLAARHVLHVLVPDGVWAVGKLHDVGLQVRAVAPLRARQRIPHADDLLVLGGRHSKAQWPQLRLDLQQILTEPGHRDGRAALDMKACLQPEARDLGAELVDAVVCFVDVVPLAPEVGAELATTSNHQQLPDASRSQPLARPTSTAPPFGWSELLTSRWRRRRYVGAIVTKVANICWLAELPTHALPRHGSHGPGARAHIARSLPCGRA